MDLELDTEIIDEFEREDEIYKDFYKDKLDGVKLFVLYIGNNNELFHIKKDYITLNENKIEKNTLIKLIKHYIMYDSKKYRLISILKWNINIEPDEISKYLKDETDFDFITNIRHLKTINFDDSINLFHNLNSLYLIFHEKWKLMENKTKKIYIKNKLNTRKTRSKKT